jgi:hypothetical protein
MKYGLAIIAVVFMLLPAAQSQGLPLNWVLFPEYRTTTSDMYYDSNSLQRIDEKTRTASFLKVFPSPQQILKSKSPKIFNSQLRVVAVDCESMVWMTVANYLFLEKFPTLNSIPVSTEVATSAQEAKEAQSTDKFFRLLCGPQV